MPRVGLMFAIQVALFCMSFGPLCKSEAKPIQLPSIQRWVAESDLIIWGRVFEVTRAGSEDGREAKVQIQGVVKGQVKQDSVRIDYNQPVTDQVESVSSHSLYRVQEKECDLFFLSTDGDGRYKFADAQYGPVRLSCSGAIIPTFVASRAEKIEALIASSLLDPEIDSGGAVSWEIRLLGRPQFVKTLREFSMSEDVPLRGMAFAALVRLGDYSVLRQAVDFLGTTGGDDSGRVWKSRIIEAISQIGGDQIRRSLEAGGRSTSCPSQSKHSLQKSELEFLESLLESGDVDLRRASSRALRGICDPSSAAHLARALNDSDKEVQYDAIMGLAALEDFPKGLPTPTQQAYEKNPAEFLAVWKEWWKRTGHRKYLTGS